MSLLMKHLSYDIPQYVRTDTYIAGHACIIKKQRRPNSKIKKEEASSGQRSLAFSCKVFLSSSHGDKCPIPSIESASVCIHGPEGFYVDCEDGLSASFSCTAEGLYTAKWSIRLKAQLNPPKSVTEHEYQFTIGAIQGKAALEDRKLFKPILGRSRAPFFRVSFFV